MKLIIRQLFLLFTLAISFSCLAEEKTALIVKSSDKKIYQSLIDSLQASTEHNAHDNISFTEVSLSDSLAQTNILNLRKDYDLIITIGTIATQQIINSKPASPVYSVLVPKKTYHSILENAALTEDLENKYHAIYLDQPPSRYLALLSALMPNTSTLGALSSPNSQRSVQQLKEESKQLDYSLYIESAKENDEVAQAAKQLFRNIDALIAVPDPIIYNKQNAKWLLYMSYRQKIPVIAYSESFVKAGALAAIYSTPEQIGFQLGELLQQHVVSNDMALTQSEHPKYYKTSINSTVAKSLNITIPDLTNVENLAPEENRR